MRSQLLVELGLHTQGIGLNGAAPFEIENEQGMAELAALQSQDLRAGCAGTAVAVGMHARLEFNGPDAQGLRPLQRTFSANSMLLSAAKTKRSFIPNSQLRIPDANSTPKSGSPDFQSRKAGCSLPAIMSVAPLSSLAKQSTSAGSSMFNATGLCVAMRTWLR